MLADNRKMDATSFPVEYRYCGNKKASMQISAEARETEQREDNSDPRFALEWEAANIYQTSGATPAIRSHFTGSQFTPARTRNTSTAPTTRFYTRVPLNPRWASPRPSSGNGTQPCASGACARTHSPSCSAAYWIRYAQHGRGKLPPQPYRASRQLGRTPGSRVVKISKRAWVSL